MRAVAHGSLDYSLHSRVEEPPRRSLSTPTSSQPVADCVIEASYREAAYAGGGWGAKIPS